MQPTIKTTVQFGTSAGLLTESVRNPPSPNLSPSRLADMREGKVIWSLVALTFCSRTEWTQLAAVGKTAGIMVHVERYNSLSSTSINDYARVLDRRPALGQSSARQGKPLHTHSINASFKSAALHPFDVASSSPPKLSVHLVKNAHRPESQNDRHESHRNKHTYQPSPPCACS
jgi:hypothetical protein